MMASEPVLPKPQRVAPVEPVGAPVFKQPEVNDSGLAGQEPRLDTGSDEVAARVDLRGLDIPSESTVNSLARMVGSVPLGIGGFQKLDESARLATTRALVTTVLEDEDPEGATITLPRILLLEALGMAVPDGSV